VNNITLIEEAAFVEEGIRDAIILPLVKRRGSVLLTISTLGLIFDSWKQVTEAKDDHGRPVFLSKTYSMVCDDCIEKGIEDKCLHKQDLLPRWQSPEEEAKVKALMSSNPDAWRREALGIQGGGDFVPAFDAKGLAFLTRREPPSTTTRLSSTPGPIIPRGPDGLRETPETCMVSKLQMQHYRYCFIAVDPAAGSTCSNYAVISTVWEPDGTVVVRNLFLTSPSLSFSLYVCVLVVDDRP